MKCIACGSSDVKDRGFIVSGSYILNKCNKCGLNFLDCRGEKDTSSDEYWDEINKEIYSTHAVINELRQKYLRYINIARGRAPNGNMLDVGSGSGVFVDTARKAGMDATGLEPSSKGARFSQSKYDIPVICDHIRPDDSLPRDYGILALWDVIEHVADPKELLEVCADHLSGNGVLVLETPDEGSLLRYIINVTTLLSGGLFNMHSKIYYRPHRYYFTKRAMRILLTRCGFDRIEFFRDHTMFEKSLMKLRLYRGLSPTKERLLKLLYGVLQRAPFLAGKMVVVSQKMVRSA